jgi:hypothetical protein
MTESLFNPPALREAIKASCIDGVPSQTISRLIACYVPADIAAECDMPDRLAVELIPADQRAFFFEALQHLSSKHNLAA